MLRLSALLLLVVLLSGSTSGASSALELRGTAYGGRVRPDNKGYTSNWQSGAGYGAGLEVLTTASHLSAPRRANVGFTIWTEFADLPGRTRQAFLDTLSAEHWTQAAVYFGVRAHLTPIPRLHTFSVTLDIATGWGVLDFGRVLDRGAGFNFDSAAQRVRDDLGTLGAGVEFLGDAYGVFVEDRSEFYTGNVTYTWNVIRGGVSVRLWHTAN